MARSGSTRGKRSPAVRIGDHTVSVGRPKRGFALRLAGLAAAGVGLRALYLFTVGRDVTGAGDWHFYHWQANLIAEGRGFIEPFKFLFDHHVSPSAGHPPLYPLALAVVSKLGGTGELSHRALGLILGACTIVLVGLLGRRAGGERLGLLAAGLCAVYPLMIAVDGALMSETLYGPLVAVALLAAWRMLDRPGPWIALAHGRGDRARRADALRGAAAAGACSRGRSAWRGGAGWPLRAALSTLACALVIAPWAIRNADRFGAFVPISTNDSTVLAGANCPLTYHGIDLGGWNIECISKRRDDNEAEQAAIWRREATDYAREHAGRLPVVAAVRLLRVWDLWQPRRQVMFAEGRQRRVEQAGVAVYFAFLVLGALGAVALHRRGVTAARAAGARGGGVRGRRPRLRRPAAAPRLRDPAARAGRGRDPAARRRAAGDVTFGRGLALIAAAGLAVRLAYALAARQVQAAARRRARVPPAGQPAGRRQGLHPALPLPGRGRRAGERRQAAPVPLPRGRRVAAGRADVGLASARRLPRGDRDRGGRRARGAAGGRPAGGAHRGRPGRGLPAARRRRRVAALGVGLRAVHRARAARGAALPRCAVGARARRCWASRWRRRR